MSLFDIPNLENKLQELEKQTSQPGFWEDTEKTTIVLTEIKKIKNKYTKYKNIEKEIKNLLELSELVKLEFDEEIANEIIKSTKNEQKNLEKLDLENMIQIML